ncbi:ABC transporter ATP-binding protein [Ensifer sp. ENS01]|nr:ABC transporter ATP-binding protein [Ensifer sp. ENS01]
MGQPSTAGPDPVPSYISIENLAKSYGVVTAVNNINLGIERGEFFSLLGPSGCGKSTLLRMIAGFETPTSGAIRLEGADVTDVPAHRRPTNMMFQSYALFPHLTVGKNIAFGLQQDGLDKSEIRKRIDEVSEKLQLTALLDRKPAQLSGGQRQRVALARALVKRPKVLLLDEPLGALDKNLRTETQLELVRLQRELGLTFIIVTHDQHEAMTVSTRIAIMKQGQVLQVGSPSDVYEAPRSRYVAKFLGETNVFAGGRSERDGEELRIESDEAGGGVRAAFTDRVALDRPFWVSVRPERVELAASGSGLEGNVEQLTYTGVERHYRVRLKSGATLDARRVNLGAESDLRVGDRVFASWPPQASRLLAE